MTLSIKVVPDCFFSRPPVDPFAMGGIHGNPMESLRDSSADDGHLSSLHAIQKTFLAPAVELVDEAALSKLVDKAQFDKILHLRLGRLGIRQRLEL